ncbi:uncharacterized protein LOC116105536 [Pistacia vera]|uniref:uncharacterized protein LOC116105536 n=1 Tax=Pistacia vera TaxID=55513 RepID=UPI0012638457|nr:uncharacterized protein LOC116105536 [Pistacia vera]
MMKMGGDLLKWLFIILLALVLLRVYSVSAVCELSFTDHDKRINYSLATPLAMFPHGVLSEDGFYKVAVNETVLWFQLCDEMLFNHDPPRCVDCLDCGGPSRCGSECSALVANNIDGYDVCNTIGLVSRTNIKVMVWPLESLSVVNFKRFSSVANKDSHWRVYIVVNFRVSKD